MALVSPGVEVTIVDQSQYLPAPTNSIPLFIVATAQNKTDATSTSIAAATTKANANKLYQVTSQRDLVTLYGNPFFYNDTNGTPINGYELNEYGLLAAYSALGISNRAYVLRADINLSELVGKTSRPVGTVADGTYWLNSATSTWGIYEYMTTVGRYWFTQKTPIVITNPAAQMNGGIPIPSLGNIGDYAVRATTITTQPSIDSGKEYFYKTTKNVWVPLGGVEWRRDVPTVTATVSNPILTPGGKFVINIGGLYSTTITINPVPTNTVADVAQSINGLSWAGLTAEVRDGKLCIFHSDNATEFLTLTQDPLVDGTGNPLGELGIPGFTLTTTSTETKPFYQPGFTYGTSAQMPLWTTSQTAPRPNGSIWMKVGAAGTGFNPVLNMYSAATASWRGQTVNIGTSDWAMTSALDSVGGATIPAGSIYAQYNYNNEYNEGPNYLYKRIAAGPTVVTGLKVNFVTSATPSQLRVQVSVPNSATLSREYIVNIGASLTPVDFVTAWSAAGIPYTTAEVTVSGAVRLTHIYGGEIILNDYQWRNNAYTSSGLLSSIGFITGATAGVKYGPSAAPRFYFTVKSTRSSGNYVIVDDASMLQVGDLVGFDREIGTLNSSTEYIVTSIDTSMVPPTMFTVAPAITPGVNVVMMDAFDTVYGSKLEQTATTSSTGIDAKFLVSNYYGDYKLIGDGVAYGGVGTAGGSTYSIGDLITIDGSQLGGASTTNDLTLKVTANCMASFNAASGTEFSGRMFQTITKASAITATFAVFTGAVDVINGGAAQVLVVQSMASGSITAGLPGVYIQNTDGLAPAGTTAGLTPLTANTEIIPSTLAPTHLSGAPQVIAISTITDNVTSFTVAAPGPWVQGMEVTIAGASNAFYDGTWIISSTDGGTAFTVAIPTTGVGNATGGTALGLGSGGVGWYSVTPTSLTTSQTITQYRSMLTVTWTTQFATTWPGPEVWVGQNIYQLNNSGQTLYALSDTKITGSPTPAVTPNGTAAGSPIGTDVWGDFTGVGALFSFYLDKPQSFGVSYVGLDDQLSTSQDKYMYVDQDPVYGHIQVNQTNLAIYSIDGATPADAAPGNGSGTQVSIPGMVKFIEGTFGKKGIYWTQLPVNAISTIADTGYTMPSQELTVFAMESGVIEAGQILSGQPTVLAPTGIGSVYPAIATAATVTKNLYNATIIGDILSITTGPLAPYTNGDIEIDQVITGLGIPPGTKIIAMNDGYGPTGINGLTGTGGVGTYKINTSLNIPDVLISTSGTGKGGVGTYTISSEQWDMPNTPWFSNAGAVGAVTLFSGSAVETIYKTQLSNWYPISWTASPTAPTASPLNGTNWYHFSVNEVDIMVQKNGQWIGYRNTGYDFNGHPSTINAPATDPAGPIVSASMPTTQSDGLTPLSWGDLWLDTSDLENYPRLYRWQSVNGGDTWVAIDTTDQVTANGIVFADARWAQNGTVDPINDPVPPITTLLTSNHIDLDAPSPALYPQGTLLWNTRRSGYVVKEFRTNYFTNNNYPDTPVYDPNNPASNTNLPLYSYTWVTVSGNKSNGMGYFGRKAQRIMVVRAMIAALAISTTVRDEDNFFNLIAAPGYPELQPAMITLNNDRGNTAFIVGDTPFRLSDQATALQNWATNAANADATGEDGLVSRDTYLGIFYPSGMTTDLSGNQVVVPASHAMVRTFLKNDSIGYPWFAAAGTRRGVIDNLTNIGYIKADTGEFEVIKTRVGIRDVLYTNQINPLAFFTGVGLLSYGNKSSFDSQSALDRINVVRLVAYIRRALTLAARPFIFEPNDELTRQQILSVVQSLFADLVAKRGVYDYLVVCDTSNNTPARIDRNELWVDVAIEPVKAVEFIYIPVRILNTGELGNK